ncbi:DEAD-box family helicase, putative [Theileria annulata]|uniref:ATP-dependent RNA helicase n=1 Tax=Theileria annulata TaxID=5874 RepID=Q4UIZ0_THEAN|nr:DEAD-box family helicase, putative [Theileria annulata]CAI72949.1 DEAD-box family helicase, putative [Theileria annulata]|eukprot:XP_953627.1 DEAD-box family helicase, putative [Theileria annulata]
MSFVLLAKFANNLLRLKHTSCSNINRINPLSTLNFIYFNRRFIHNNNIKQDDLDENKNSCNSGYKLCDLVKKNDLGTKTRFLINKLKFNHFDKFQSQIFQHIIFQGYSMNSLPSDPGKTCENSNNIDLNDKNSVLYVVGNSNSGKTSSYLLALNELINNPKSQYYHVYRDNHRHKMILYSKLRGGKLCKPRGFRRINGAPRLNPDSFTVPLAIILVPFRELGQNIFQTCDQMGIRSRLITGGFGYKLLNKSSSDSGGDDTNGMFIGLGNFDVIISTPEMLLRIINGEYEDFRLDVKYLKFLIFEDSDLLVEEMYLPKINEILNLLLIDKLSLVYVSRVKSSNLTDHVNAIGSPTVLEKAETHNLDHFKKIFVYTYSNDKLEVLIDLINEITHNNLQKTKIVIFTNTTNCNKFLKYSLLDRGYRISNLFGGMNYEERTENLRNFESDADILITTNFASRFKFNCTINNIILFDFPKNIQQFIHHTSSFTNNSNNKMYLMFNNKNIGLMKEMISLSSNLSGFEYRNLTPKLSKKLSLYQKSLLKHNFKRAKAVKKVEFLRKRGILKKSQTLPKMCDRNVEMSDSQEYLRMERTPDGFLQIIPKRRSRIRNYEVTKILSF